ncbi:superoxide dismutase, iron/manganese cofactor [Baffinella frigidus]|nr:superoxide dismutase, iron/manganese cofactor [Cryptophyta sp. CCMP2293]|mmetsp:Transcript_46502/g.106017  ORF Transcript_46502/g.106017 Transcript_46502/m.106017 type:complete len:200 (+) Transcript_46502:32-631(+)
MGIELPPLPYAYDALEPKISKQTLTIHHDKHHAKYVTVATDMIKETDMKDDDCATILMKAHKAGNAGLFNNAAQSWNHAFYWNCMKAGGGGKPTGDLLAQIEKDFGSFEEFSKQFETAGLTAFGSGWAWLSWDGSKLVVDKTIGAGNPMTDGKKPVLTMDVWEHAYYIDYQNLRPDYIKAFLDSLVNWEFVATTLAAAK